VWRLLRDGSANAASLLPEPTASVLWIRSRHREDILLDDRVDAPISINHLGDAEVDSDRSKRKKIDRRSCVTDKRYRDPYKLQRNSLVKLNASVAG